MKVERLYAITIYLLNHGRTSAGELAKHFEVSVRTIQRDIDSLCLSGIPVAAVAGAAGGYEIAEKFILDKQLATSEDYSCILTALKGLVSATNDPGAKHILEKIDHVFQPGDSGMILDFSVLQEGNQSALHKLQAAIAKQRTVDFLYTNNNNETRMHHVEPIAVIYRWYGWYLLAYSIEKKDYRTYKLVRMRNLSMTDAPFSKEHEPADVILRNSDKADARRYTDILIRCSQKAQPRVYEYLKGTVMEEYANGDTLMKLTVVENEQLWLGTLLSLGNSVEIIAPDRLRRQLADTALSIVSLYK